MADSIDLTGKLYVRFHPDAGTDSSAFEPKANIDHAGYFEVGVTVNGVEVPINRWKGGQYDIPLDGPKQDAK